MPILLIKILIALALDQFLGEPKHWHPLVGFGRLADRLEQAFNHGGNSTRLALGILAWCLAVLPLVLVAIILSFSPVSFAVDTFILYLAIGRKSLFEHSQRVYDALRGNDLNAARTHTGMMVSRETDALDATGCARATIESVLENGNDSIIGALFWFILLGAPGVVLYRLANTLDAMWGYRNDRFLHFGRAAARIDDVLNYIPARLCALAYAAAGHFRRGIQCWRQQARHLKSPNGGPVMTAGAGALNLQLGGPAVYHGKPMDKPWFGGDNIPQPEDILKANRLVDRAVAILILFWWGLML